MKANRFFDMIRGVVDGACDMLVSYETPYWTIVFNDGGDDVTISFKSDVRKRYSVRLTERLAYEALYELGGEPVTK